MAADAEAVKNILKTALDGLERRIDVARQNGEVESPVYVIVVGNASKANTPSDLKAGNRCEQPTAHPGLERFLLAESSSKPKGASTCFMEPDRPCVNSGACELRGF